MWSDGSIETCIYDQNGVQNGPAKLTWPSGAVRQGQKKDGQWHGLVYYTYSEGPRKGQADQEQWNSGEMIKSQKHRGSSSKGGKTFEVEDWDDLEKMDELTVSNMSN